MLRIDLNGLYGTREAADDLLARVKVASSLKGDAVVIYCRDLLTGSTSFADELIKELVSQRHAASVLLVGAPEPFASYALAAAERRGLGERVRLESAAAVAV